MEQFVIQAGEFREFITKAATIGLYVGYGVLLLSIGLSVSVAFVRVKHRD